MDRNHPSAPLFFGLIVSAMLAFVVMLSGIWDHSADLIFMGLWACLVSVFAVVILWNAS